jgi:hypothetical protein
MATRATSRITRRKSVADPRHLLRFLKSQAGQSPADIAKSEGVSIAVVKGSINKIDGYRRANTSGELDFAIRDLVISSVPIAKESLHGLLAATERVEETDYRTGKKKVVVQEDKTTRLEAQRLLKDLIVGLQPKAAPVAVNVQQNNQNANLGSSETLEERLRRLRKQADEHNLLPPEVAGTPAHIDAGEDAEDDDGDDEDDEE